MSWWYEYISRNISRCPSGMNIYLGIFRSPGGMKISPGQVLGTALLLQEENISLALLKAEQHEQE